MNALMKKELRIGNLERGLEKEQCNPIFRMNNKLVETILRASSAMISQTKMQSRKVSSTRFIICNSFE